MALSTESSSVAAVAPWWHTVVVMLLIGLFSAQSAMHQGLPGFALTGLSIQLSRYLSVIVMEWILILFIWMAMKQRGISMRNLIGGRWATAGSFFKDLGLGLAFTLVGIIVIGAISRLIGGNTGTVVAGILPRTPLELTGFLALSLTGGFCEEFIFRGYLMRQFGAWSGSWIVAVIAQGVAFGLAHGYYGVAMIAVATYGCMLGLLAHWRKSLRPGIIAHTLQDTLGGVLGYFTMK